MARSRGLGDVYKRQLYRLDFLPQILTGWKHFSDIKDQALHELLLLQQKQALILEL
jgi:hypothetical protein